MVSLPVLRLPFLVTLRHIQSHLDAGGTVLCVYLRYFTGIAHSVVQTRKNFLIVVAWDISQKRLFSC